MDIRRSLFSVFAAMLACTAAVAGTGNFTITAGDESGKTGYCDSVCATSFGSIDTRYLSDGKAVEFFFDLAGYALAFRVSGFTSDPGKSYFDQIYINCDAPPENYTSAAASYLWDAGTGIAQWIWPRSASVCMTSTYTYFLDVVE